MAKISAHGATKLATRKTPHGTYVLRSDGKILWKSTVAGDHYTVTARISGDPTTFQHVFSGMVRGRETL